jgi:uncharacterized protein YkvS
MIVNLTLTIQLEQNLSLTEDNNLVKFKDIIVGRITKYNRNTGKAKVEITDEISAKRLMKKSNTNFLNFDINKK